MKRPGDGPVEDVRARDDRDRETTEAQVAEQLVELARIVADLGDCHLGARPDLRLELEVLGEKLALLALERVDRGAKVKATRLGRPANLAVHREQTDRVKVEHRPRQPFVTVDRIVA